MRDPNSMNTVEVQMGQLATHINADLNYHVFTRSLGMVLAKWMHFLMI